MHIKSRLLTGPIDLYTAANNVFSNRVQAVLKLGFSLHGSPALTFNSVGGYLKAAQSVEGHFEGGWEKFITLAAIPKPEKPIENVPLYRLLAGKDDSAFCAFIEEKLQEVWELYGSPALTSMGEDDIAAQALIKKSPEPNLL